MENAADLGPIEPSHHDQMNTLAIVLDEILNGVDCPVDLKAVGFFLTVFPFNEQGRFNYISNADKIDVRAMLKDVMARIEGRMAQAPKAKQCPSAGASTRSTSWTTATC